MARTVGRASALVDADVEERRRPRCWRSRTWSIRLGLGPGPSSKVSATVRPVPGAVALDFSPGAGGQRRRGLDPCRPWHGVGIRGEHSADGGGARRDRSRLDEGSVHSQREKKPLATTGTRPARCARRALHLRRTLRSGVDGRVPGARATCAGRCRSGARTTETAFRRGLPCRSRGYAVGTRARRRRRRSGAVVIRRRPRRCWSWRCWLGKFLTQSALVRDANVTDVACGALSGRRR